MSNYSKLYWLTRLDNLQAILITLLVLSIIGTALYIIAYNVTKFDPCNDDGDLEKYVINWKWMKNISVTTLIVVSLLLTFIPTKNEVIFIVAGGKTMDFIQSDTSINKIPAQTTAVIAKMLNDELKKLNSCSDKK